MYLLLKTVESNLGRASPAKQAARVVMNRKVSQDRPGASQAPHRIVRNGRDEPAES
jgi:hypothetical protein